MALVGGRTLKVLGAQKGGGSVENTSGLHLGGDVHGVYRLELLLRSYHPPIAPAQVNSSRVLRHSIVSDCQLRGGVNSDGVMQQVQDQDMQAERARRKNSENRCNDDRHLYGLRHLVENAFTNAN